MILLFVAAGLMMGSMLNWAADYLPRYASGEPARPIQIEPTFELATWAMLRSIIPKQGRGQMHWLNSVVELCSALLAVYLWRRFGLSWNLLWLAGLSALFILLAIVDLKYHLILNALVLPAGALALLRALVSGEANLTSVLLGGGLGLGMFALAAFLRPGELGAGDIKLAAFIGLLFGFPYALWALLVGVGSGGVGAVALLLARRGNLSSQMPYAPFLCLGALLSLFYNPLDAVIQPVVWQILAVR